MTMDERAVDAAESVIAAAEASNAAAALMVATATRLAGLAPALVALAGAITRQPGIDAAKLLADFDDLAGIPRGGGTTLQLVGEVREAIKGAG